MQFIGNDSLNTSKLTAEQFALRITVIALSPIHRCDGDYNDRMNLITFGVWEYVTYGNGCIDGHSTP